MVQRLEQAVDDGDSVLVLAKRFDVNESSPCQNLLAFDTADHMNILSVVYSQSAGAQRQRLNNALDSAPANSVMIDVHGSQRLFSDQSSQDIPIETIESSDDLTELAFRILEYINKWPTEKPNYRTTICFHSITTLLQFVESESAFMFIDQLTKRLNDINAITHYHMDPRAHNNQTVEKYMSRFDVVCEHAEDSWVVRDENSVQNIATLETE